MSKEKLFDVVIYEIATLKVDSVIGKDMRREGGFYNAEKRCETAMRRINDSYTVAIVPAGKYASGDKLNRKDMT